MRLIETVELQNMSSNEFFPSKDARPPRRVGLDSSEDQTLQVDIYINVRL